MAKLTDEEWTARMQLVTCRFCERRRRRYNMQPTVNAYPIDEERPWECRDRASCVAITQAWTRP